MVDKNRILKELQVIPGVGKSIAQDLYDVGIRAVDELRDRDPEELYDRLCLRAGAKLDRRLLYVMRCAVYFASNKAHDPELLKWWHWKD